MAAKARLRVGERLIPKITEQVGQRRQFVESPPLTTRVHDERALRIVSRGIAEYLQTLDDSRRFVLDRYSLEDFAVRVVGIGSVGTRCFVALLVCDDRNPLLLQIKAYADQTEQDHAALVHAERTGRIVADAEAS